jgi:DNA-binding transcriptional MerR regulator
MMLTIGQMVRRFGLARSTLLYYDRIGLLAPSARSRAGYRLYSDDDVRRMEVIQAYRSAGLALAEIAAVLDDPSDATVSILEKRLAELNGEIRCLRHQQEQIIALIRRKDAWRECRSMTKERWTGILRAAGFKAEDMHRWHREFERLAPEGHQDFLESLGVAESEIRSIRRWSAMVDVPEEENLEGKGAGSE